MLFQILACVFHEGRVAGASALARGARVRVCSRWRGTALWRVGGLGGAMGVGGGGAIDLVMGVQWT